MHHVCHYYTVSITTKRQSEVARPICNTTLEDMFLYETERCVLASFIYTLQMILSCTIQTVEWHPEGIFYKHCENFSPNAQSVFLEICYQLLIFYFRKNYQITKIIIIIYDWADHHI